MCGVCASNDVLSVWLYTLHAIMLLLYQHKRNYNHTCTRYLWPCIIAQENEEVAGSCALMLLFLFYFYAPSRSNSITRNALVLGVLKS